MKELRNHVELHQDNDLMSFFRTVVFLNPNFKTLFKPKHRRCHKTWNLLFYRYYGYISCNHTDKKWDDFLHTKKGLQCFDQMITLLNNENYLH